MARCGRGCPKKNEMSGARGYRKSVQSTSKPVEFTLKVWIARIASFFWPERTPARCEGEGESEGESDGESESESEGLKAGMRVIYGSLV